MSRIPRPEQYGSRDLAGLSASEINAARRAGHFTDLMGGNDPDAGVGITHVSTCSRRPDPVRKYRLENDSPSVRTGEPIRYRCPECGGTTKEES